MLVMAPFSSVFFLGYSLTFMMVYVWGRRNETFPMNFLGLFNFPAPWLPWVLLAFSALLGASPVPPPPRPESRGPAPGPRGANNPLPPLHPPAGGGPRRDPRRARVLLPPGALPASPAFPSLKSLTVVMQRLRSLSVLRPCGTAT